MIDAALEFRPGPEWCLDKKPVQERAKLDAHILSLAQNLTSISKIKAESLKGTSHKLTSQKLTMIENLLFDGLGQVLVHLRMGLNFPDFITICAKVRCKRFQIAKP